MILQNGDWLNPSKNKGRLFSSAWKLGMDGDSLELYGKLFSWGCRVLNLHLSPVSRADSEYLQSSLPGG